MVVIHTNAIVDTSVGVIGFLHLAKQEIAVNIFFQLGENKRLR